ncbi:MAG: aspartate aminotransferase family protein [Cardiobacteriaceae bacterium]|nr:aspartate aminotransferase family protein [Cardiobacteriaceae bacterium]
MSFLMSSYARLPISFVRGEGCRLFDDKGREYLDALSGIAVCGLGHAHTELNEVMREQSQALWHVSNLFTVPEQERAGARLASLMEMEKVYFCNSGAEANEAALKLARLHGKARGLTDGLVVSFKGSFHGRTFGAMSLTGNPKIQDGFAPLVPNIVQLPYNDKEALSALAGKRVVAVLLETIQGEGGVNPVTPEFLHYVRRFCDEQSALMMVDEIQTGMARTGTFASYQGLGVMPDVVSMAKALGNGLPVGATLARGAAASYFQAGKHGSTFGGTPLVCAVVDKVLEIYERDNLAERAKVQGDKLREKLQSALGHQVREIRGRGLMLGLELLEKREGLMQRALDVGLVMNVTAEKVIRLLPPLIINDAEIEELVHKLTKIL